MQGKKNAPELAQKVWARWAKLNPEYEIQILDLDDARRLLSELPFDIAQVHPAALSDIVRIEILARSGGIWCDSSLWPSVPLRVWLPQIEKQGGFFALRQPDTIRPLASWFLAAKNDNYIVAQWRKHVFTYWKQFREPMDPAVTGGSLSLQAYKSMGFDGEPHQQHPYFWLHHLFAHALETDPVFAKAWQATPAMDARPPHELHKWLSRDAAAPGRKKEAILRMLAPFGPRQRKLAQLNAVAPLHKLNFRATYRPTTMQAFFALGRM